MGGDNTHNQGVRLAGRGLDAKNGSSPAPWVPYFDSTWPLPDNPPLFKQKLPDGNILMIRAVCSKALSPIPITDDRFAFCQGELSLTDANGSQKFTPACDFDDARTGKVNLLAIKGRWKSPAGKDKFGGLEQGNFVTFACAPIFPAGGTVTPPSAEGDRLSSLLSDFVKRKEAGTDTSSSSARMRASLLASTPAKPTLPPDVFAVLPMTLLDLSNIDKSHQLGVLAKCYYWGFAKARDQELLTYQACVRAARADYCGNGESYTQSGTTIQIYETPETKYGKPIEVAEDAALCPLPYLSWTPCFEAIWSPTRALCISHARYRQLPPKSCLRQLFNHQIFLDKDGFKKAQIDSAISLHCSSDDYKNLAPQSFVKNRSGINNLTQKEVESCQSNVLCP
jgi:hypothetical protein